MLRDLRGSLKPLSKLFVLINSETLLKSWKPFYVLKESIPYPGLVLVVVIYNELLLTVFSKLSGLKLKQLHIYLWALQPYHDFHDLDIPSRRPRDKYSQKSILFSSYWIAQNAKFCSWSFFCYHLFQLYQAWSRAES